jgi:hypothetical protein
VGVEITALTVGDDKTGVMSGTTSVGLVDELHADNSKTRIPDILIKTLLIMMTSKLIKGTVKP